jgi:hypothetical protein
VILDAEKEDCQKKESHVLRYRKETETGEGRILRKKKTH